MTQTTAQPELTLQQRLVKAQLEKAGIAPEEVASAVAHTPKRVEFAGQTPWGEKRYRVTFHDGSEVTTVNPSHYGGLRLRVS
jgi:hypothetical protein